MQKVFKRTAQAQKQALRRQKAKDYAEGRGRLVDRQQIVAHCQQEIAAQMRNARRARREDWTLGPLAPRRDTPLPPPQPGSQDHIKYMYGAIGNARIGFSDSGAPIRDVEVERRCAWAGGAKNICLAVGDRVVLMEGSEKGRIGQIKEVDRKAGQVKLKGVMESNITVPPWSTRGDESTVRPAEVFVPIDAVRLVHPLTDPATGRTRDVIIRQLVAMGHAKDKQTGRRTFGRVVPGLNVTIPWPQQQDGGAAPAVREEHPADTLRIDVEPSTFVPTLLRPPMPEGLIDELRNKYSRFRTRHEPEYLAKKEAEAEEKRARHNATTMRTPLQEFHIQQREMRRARGQPELSEEMLEKIGKVILKNKYGVAIEDPPAAAKADFVPPPEVTQENRAPLP